MSAVGALRVLVTGIALAYMALMQPCAAQPVRLVWIQAPSTTGVAGAPFPRQPSVRAVFDTHQVCSTCSLSNM
jgi:hypothetical protein